jgi:ketosteroid isomerase-like protein
LESANVAYARGFVDAWNRRDFQSFLDDMDPEYEWVAAHEHPGAKSNRGREEVAAYMGDWLATMPDIRVEAEELVEDGDRVLCVLRMSGTGAGSGAMTEVRMATISTFRDGKPIRTEEFLDPEEARRALAAD